MVTVAYCAVMASSGLVNGAQGPATLLLAQQIGANTTSVTQQLQLAPGTQFLPTSEMGLANTVFACSASVGAVGGGWLVARARVWHRWLAAMLVWQGVTWVLQNYATELSELLLASLLAGLPFAMPSVTTDAGLTWVWGDSVAPYMQLASAAYGAGAVLSPLLVAANIDYNGGFHASFWAIGLATATAAAAPLLVPSPHPPAVAAKPAGAAPGPPAVGGGAALLVFYSFFFWCDMLHYGL